ncbi:hypothetical protein [Bradyrhizobium sp. sBnM-33]|uniref:hypothetical protein n=1 Tax=Bradyrhizobium sp. sBnM-33 TaxID=2831780 RepID=UPI00293F310C|nr:hypothetical protein [Bradyrhizobium sp. sBnM-33]WOH48234.1 hypothetical protein RX328_29430 [Bradyrhizobium sp. sBnM-33]
MARGQTVALDHLNLGVMDVQHLAEIAHVVPLAAAGTFHVMVGLAMPLASLPDFVIDNAHDLVFKRDAFRIVLL